MDNDGFKEIFTIEQSMCFGCGPSNEHGLKMKFYGNDKIVYSNVVIPDYMVGWKNIVHGGITSTILDECMGRCAMFLLRKFAFTKSIAVNYHKPLIAGEMLKVESEIKEHISDREVSMLGRIFNSKGELCTTSTGTMAMVGTEFIKKLGMDDKDVEDVTYMVNVRYHEGKSL
ncbi:MAG: PaaI family thioesterase [Leptospirales bacterium]|nr:PaaI family thioesterase [Leptospirales bacterium]